MNDAKVQALLYRILQGRLRLVRSGLVVYIEEASRELLQESFEIYDSAYHEAYLNGVWVEDEIKEILLKNDIWSPLNDDQLEKSRKDIDQEKLHAFQSYYKKRELNFIKRRIRFLEAEMADLVQRKHSMDHLSCSGVAEYTRWRWIISKCAFVQDKKLYDFDKYSTGNILNAYRRETIDQSELREVARKDPWRAMWVTGKKVSEVFGKPSIDFTRDQLALCGVSSMYDSVYESPDSPNEKVVEDDDCLDGWFVAQKRKYESDKKQAETDSMIKNPKIKNAKEVFLVAQHEEDVEQIHNMNDPLSRMNLRQRQQQIREADGNVKDLDFADVKTELQLEQNRAFTNRMRK
jgi:hypothetical protein